MGRQRAAAAMDGCSRWCQLAEVPGRLEPLPQVPLPVAAAMYCWSLWHFYILVVGYIWFSRIAVYLFATMLGYHQTWMQYFVTKLGTLVFYAVVGFLFRPEDDNPHFEVKEGDAASQEIIFLSTPPPA